MTIYKHLIRKAIYHVFVIWRPMSGSPLILLTMGNFTYIFLIFCLLNNIKETGDAFVKVKAVNTKIIVLFYIQDKVRITDDILRKAICADACSSVQEQNLIRQKYAPRLPKWFRLKKHLHNLIMYLIHTPLLLHLMEVVTLRIIYGHKKQAFCLYKR